MPVSKVFQINSDEQLLISLMECSDGLFVDIESGSFEILNYFECVLLVDYLKDVINNMERKENFINDLDIHKDE